MASATIANAAAVHALVARLEDQVLKEYSNVSHNLDEMSTVLQRLSSMQPYILNQFRPLERKLGLVLTLFKGTCPTSSVQRSHRSASRQGARHVRAPPCTDRRYVTRRGCVQVPYGRCWSNATKKMVEKWMMGDSRSLVNSYRGGNSPTLSSSLEAKSKFAGNQSTGPMLL